MLLFSSTIKQNVTEKRTNFRKPLFFLERIALKQRALFVKPYFFTSNTMSINPVTGGTVSFKSNCFDENSFSEI